MEKQSKQPSNNGLMDALQVINAKGDQGEIKKVTDAKQSKNTKENQ